MRASVIALLLLAAGGALAGCSAVDDFHKFDFVDDGGLDQGRDLAPGLPGFGDACVDQCAPSTLSCVHTVNGLTFDGGMCTRSCNPALGAVACGDLADSFCVDVGGMGLCLPRCDPQMGSVCRPKYACCNNGKMVTMPGVCAPPDTNNVCR
jgi:hypothetical protein